MDNRDHSRSDAASSLDHPYQRFKDAWPLRRRTSEVELKEWSRGAAETLPQPCRLCKNTEFISREDWLRHVNEVHGGLQRYRNAMFCLLSTKPYAVTGQEWRAVVAKYSEFMARSAMDWERFNACDDGSAEHRRGFAT